MNEVTAISTMNGRDAGETSDPRQNTFDDDLENMFKEVDEILENDKSKSGKGDGDPCETAEEWQPGREGPLKSKIKGACCEKREELPYHSSDQHGDGMLSAQPAQQRIVHHLPQEFVGPGSRHAQNNAHPGHMINHPTNFNFGPVYNMAGLGSWSPQSRGTGTDDHARKKKDELRVELEVLIYYMLYVDFLAVLAIELHRTLHFISMYNLWFYYSVVLCCVVLCSVSQKVLCQPSNAGSWHRFDVLRTELQVLEAPLCGIVTQPDEVLHSRLREDSFTVFCHLITDAGTGSLSAEIEEKTVLSVYLFLFSVRLFSFRSFFPQDQ
ncbi:Hypp1948 [Branchiostoma lanceolatum]|uniref:Hypp1948 protein n=1 Tax=Branchiostoma lanceolatum TaxID=7740 RepID=A0A8K0EKZ4_BRALA|nr:Hypp1948 [Branchiostoma lanceolatum]